MASTESSTRRVARDPGQGSGALRLMAEPDLARALAASARTPEPYLTEALSNELLHRVASYAHAVSAAQDGIIVTDVDGRITYTNPAAERTLGIATTEARGRLADEILQASSAAPGEPAIRNALHAGRTHRWQGATIQTADGPLRVDVTISTGRTDTGMRGGIIVFRAAGASPEQTHLEAHAHAIALIAWGGPMGEILETIGATLDQPAHRHSVIITLDPSRRKVSRVIANTLSSDLAEALRGPVTDILLSGNVDFAQWRQAWNGLEDAAGSYKLAAAEPVVDRHGGVEGAVLLLDADEGTVDRQARRAVEMAAQLVNAALARDHAEMCRSLVQSLLASSQDGICSIDASGNITSWSRSAETHFGRSASAAIGSDFRDLFGETGSTTAEHILNMLVHQVGETTHVIPVADRGAPAGLLSLTVTPMVDAHGVRVGASVFARPVPPAAARALVEKPAKHPVPVREHEGAPLPADEDERLRALRSYDILDTPAESPLDDLARLASEVTGMPIALVSLVDEGRQWFKSRHNFPAEETPREQSFCAHAILQPDEPLVVPDAREDVRFGNNPLVTGETHLRAYAGVSLTPATGQPLGTLCVLDKVPRVLGPQQLEWLKIIADQVVAQIELRRLSANYANALLARDRLRDENATLKRQLQTHHNPGDPRR